MAKDREKHRKVKAGETPVVEEIKAPADKCQVYAWLDLRLDTPGRWRYLAIFNDKVEVSANVSHSQEQALDRGLDLLRGLSDYKVKYFAATSEAVEAGIELISDRLPPESVWKEAEKVFDQRHRKAPDAKEIGAAINEIIKRAEGLGEDAATFGGFADAAAIDELISRATLGKLAIQHLSAARRGPPRGMFPMAMFDHRGPRW